ncbi:MAG: 50S ribosomal protein L21 [Planktomarina sp.]|nr:50S ribosomal protein L21 [Planktomarina sp.]
MFAVMKTGGKQYRVQSGDVLRVEKLAANAGETIQFNEVLMVGAAIGTPLVEDAGVQAEVIDQIKGPKLINFVKRRRKHSSKRTKGHRQKLTLVRIKDILEKGADKSGVKAAMGAGSVPYSERSEPVNSIVNKAVKAKPAAVKAKPAAVKAKPAAVKAKPAVVTAKSASVKAKPAASKAKPAVAKKPAATKTKPAVAKKPAAKKE